MQQSVQATNPETTKVTHAQLRQWDRETLWHAFSQMSDYDGLIIESGHGVYLRDLEGRDYIDGVSSMWCNIHGHSHPAINAAISEQLQKISHVSLLGLASPNVIELSRRLCQLAPDGLKHVFYASDGASAIEVAMKMAFQFWRQHAKTRAARDLFLCVGGAYHGDTLGAVSVGGVSRFKSMFHPLLFPVVQGPMPICNRSDRQDRSQVDRLLAEYDQLLNRHPGKIAAIIVEPLVQAAAGIVFHPEGFLAGLRELADRHDTLLIADEIAVGFGKTGQLFACENECVRPDFLCLGKGLSGGYLPLSAVLTTDRVWDAFLGEYSESKSFFHGHTFGGNPLAAAAALASLDLFESENTLAELPAKSHHLRQQLQLLADHPNVSSIRVLGLIAAFELTPDKSGNQSYPWEQRRGARLCREALKHGVWLRPLGNTIVIMPPLCISNDQLTQLVSSIAASIDVAVA